MPYHIERTWLTTTGLGARTADRTGAIAGRVAAVKPTVELMAAISLALTMEVLT